MMMYLMWYLVQSHMDSLENAYRYSVLSVLHSPYIFCAKGQYFFQCRVDEPISDRSKIEFADLIFILVRKPSIWQRRQVENNYTQKSLFLIQRI